MSQPTEIIVYRNPIEAMFWDFITNSPYIWPGIVSFMAMLFVFMITDSRRVRSLMGRMGLSYDAKTHVILVSAIAAGVATFWWMVR